MTYDLLIKNGTVVTSVKLLAQWENVLMPPPAAIDEEEGEDDVDSEEADEETDEEALTYNETFNVWVHEVSGMYYGVNDIESVPLGQLKSGKLVPFKKPSGGKRIGAN